MTADEFGAFIFGLFIAFMLMLIVLCCATGIQREGWQENCIKHGAAQYNPTTGAFEWKVKVEDDKR